MWTLQSTSASQRSPGGCRFSPCLKWKGPIHQRLFVTGEKGNRAFVHKLTFFFCIIYSRMCTRISVCTTSTCQMRRDDEQGRVTLFQPASSMTGTSTACTLLITPPPPSIHTAVRERIETKQKHVKVALCSFPMQQMGQIFPG